MKKHSVKAQVQILDLTRAGSSMKLEIYDGDGKLGEMRLGQGSITWFKRKARTGRGLTWSQFAAMMNRELYGE